MAALRSQVENHLRNIDPCSGVVYLAERASAVTSIMRPVYEDIGYSAEDWAAMEAEAKETFLAAAKVRSVLPAGPPPTDRYWVTVPTLRENQKDGKLLPLEVEIRAFVPLRISRDFKIRSDQMSDRALLRQLVRDAAHRLGLEESKRLIDHAPETDGNGNKHWVGLKLSAENAAGENGAVNEKDILDAVLVAAESLLKKDLGGPYALVLSPRLSTRYASDIVGRSTARQGLSYVLGDDLKVVTLASIDQKNGYLISLGSGSIDLVDVDPLSLSKVGEDDGDLVLRLEERIVLRTMDENAVVELTVAESPKDDKTA